jgi:hypothetical protein
MVHVRVQAAHYDGKTLKIRETAGLRLTECALYPDLLVSLHTHERSDWACHCPTSKQRPGAMPGSG